MELNRTEGAPDSDSLSRSAVAASARTAEASMELGQAQSELRKVAQFPDQNPSPVMRVSGDGVLLYANRNSGPLLEAWRCELGRPIPAELRALIGRALRDRQTHQIDQDIGIRAYTLTAAPFPELGYVNLYGSDITERKRAEESLRRSEELHRLLVSIHDATRGLRSPERVIWEVVQRVGLFFGVQGCAYGELDIPCEEVVIHRDYAQDVPSLAGRLNLSGFGHDTLRDLREGRTVVATDSSEPGGRPRTVPPVLRARGGTRAAVLVPLLREKSLQALFLLYDRAPKVWSLEQVHWIEQVAERTWTALESCRAELALRESQDVLSLAMAAGQMGAWSRDLLSERVWWSPELEELFGLPPGAFGGSEAAFFELVHEEDREKVSQAVQTALETRSDYAVEFRFRHASGEWRHMEGRGRAVYGSGARALTLYGIGIDVTARRRAQEALRESEERLQQHAAMLEKTVADRTAKLQETIGDLEAFSYSVSHDMRAPLRAMQSFSRAVIDEYGAQLDAAGRDLLTRIERGANRLDLLVQDVLAYSRISNGDHPLARVDLVKLTRDLVQTYPNFQEPNATVVIQAIPEVLGHEALLSQVVSNLLGNAVKFVAPGTKPVVRIYSEPEGNLVRIWVVDNGIGIDPVHHQRIFQIFGRVYSEKRFEGTGIGLAIVRRAVQRLGGEVGLESELGHGSRFWLTLKCA